MSGKVCIINLRTFLSQPRCKTNKYRYTMPIFIWNTALLYMSTDKWQDAISTILIHFQIPVHVLVIFVLVIFLWSWTIELALNRKLWIYIDDNLLFGIPKFLKNLVLGNFCSIWFSSWNFWFNSLLFRNSTISRFSGTLKFPHQFQSLFQKFWNF